MPAVLSIGKNLSEFSREVFTHNETVDNWFDRNEASLPKGEKENHPILVFILNFLDYRSNLYKYSKTCQGSLQ